MARINGKKFPSGSVASYAFGTTALARSDNALGQNLKVILSTEEVRVLMESAKAASMPLDGYLMMALATAFRAKHRREINVEGFAYNQKTRTSTTGRATS